MPLIITSTPAASALLPQPGERRIGQVRHAALALRRPVEHLAASGRRRLDGASRRARYADERQRRFAVEELVVAVPLLAALARVDTSSRSADTTSPAAATGRSPIVRKSGIGTVSTGGSSRKKKPDRRVRLASEVLQLLQRRRGLTGQPRLVAGEAPLPDLGVDPGPGACPLEHARSHLDPHAHDSSPPRSDTPSIGRRYREGVTTIHAVCLARRLVDRAAPALRPDPLQQHRRRLVRRILRHQPPLERCLQHRRRKPADRPARPRPLARTPRRTRTAAPPPRRCGLLLRQRRQSSTGDHSFDDAPALRPLRLHAA